MKDKFFFVRFRCGNEESKNKFWLEEEERKCRVCDDKRETLVHMLKEYEGLREEVWRRTEMLDENGRGKEWMKKVLRARGRAKQFNN